MKHHAIKPARIPLMTAWVALSCLLTQGWAQEPSILRLDQARVLISPALGKDLRTTLAEVALQEVGRRSGANWTPAAVWAESPGPVVVLALRTDQEVGGLDMTDVVRGDGPEHRPEGYRLVSGVVSGRPVVRVIGADGRGVLFGLGKLLTLLRFSPGGVGIPEAIDLASAPVYALRGHQLGYRDAANSWDAWEVARFDQYIRELALLGANCIENIPLQGGPPGPHMKVPRPDMNRAMSRICARYGLDYWIWTPSEANLAEPAQRAAEVERHAAVYRECERLDGVFFPGGDPGDNHPRDVMPFLEALARRLHEVHPLAGIWVSLQGFNEEKVDWFYGYVATNAPAWLRGVVSGPGSPPLAETRQRLPRRYLHRHYPDLTHNVRCQYPVENWDQAFALTLGREACNPRPAFFARVHNRFAPYTDGFLSYSDGVHDDVNKAVWTQLAWDPAREVRSILVDYGRLFFGAAAAEAAAEGVLALERNWSGPAEFNGGVATTAAYWDGLASAHPGLSRDWRWQLLLLRADYDAYTRLRKIREQALEREANLLLGNAAARGSQAAMAQALACVQSATQTCVAPALRQRIDARCETLFQLVGLQTSVPRYRASGAERGCLLDFVDYPLNNRLWLEDRFKEIAALPTEAARLERLDIIRSWEHPGPGSFYDNVSDVVKGPRVQTRSDDGTDVAWWDDGWSRRRLSTQLFQPAPRLVYEDLDPAGRYVLRVSGFGEALARADGVRLEPGLYGRGLEEFKEFVVPGRLVGDGRLEVTFDVPEESQLNWRKQSKVSDVWLLRR